MREDDLRQLGGWIVTALRNSGDAPHLEALRREVEAYCLRFPVPGLGASPN